MSSEWFISIIWLTVAIHIMLTWLLAWYRGRQARRKPQDEFPLKQQPLVSILIPAWNERRVLGQTLEALRQSDYPHWEAIIIAGGPDGTCDAARQRCADWPNFTVIEQPPRGKNAALNLGLQYARGEIIVLLDADTIVASDWLRHLVAPLTHGYTAATANYFPLRQTWVSTYLEMEKIAARYIRHNATLQGCGIALRRQAIEAMGGFPEAVTVGVDWDLSQRLRRRNARLCFASQAHARTALPDTLAAFWRNQIRWRRAHLQATLRHLGPEAARHLLFYAVALAFLAAPGLCFHTSLWPLAPLFWAWVLLRRLSLAIECAAFDRSCRWLKHSGGLLILVVVDFIAALIALATFRRRVITFQGTRPGDNREQRL